MNRGQNCNCIPCSVCGCYGLLGVSLRPSTQLFKDPTRIRRGYLLRVGR